MYRSFITICCLLITAAVPAGAQLPFSFDHPHVINMEDGLPSEHITALTQDQDGFIWIGTVNEGVARFDGHRLETFQHIPGQDHSLPGNQIDALVVDPENRIWAGTVNGLCYYDGKSGDFQMLASADEKKAAHFRVRAFSLWHDGKNELWAGTQNDLLRYSPSTDSLISYRFSVSAPDTTFDISRINAINSIAQDRTDANIIWLGSLSGLIRFNRLTAQYQWYPNILADKDRQYLANSIKLLHALPNGELLIGSWAGAYHFSPGQGKFTAIKAVDVSRAIDMSTSTVLSFLELPGSDHIGVTYTTGFAWYGFESRKVDLLFANNERQGRLYTAHFMDRQNRIWGLSRQGVYLYNPLVNRIRRQVFPFQSSLYAILPRAVVESSDQTRLYIGALSFEGIISWDRQQDQWSVIPPPEGVEWGVGVQDMIRLEDGRILVLGHHQLYELREDSRQILPLFPNLDFGTPAFRKMVEGAPGELWIGSRRAGLFRLNTHTGALRVYTRELDPEDDPNRHTWIETLHKDSRGQIWVRTAYDYSVYLPQEDQFYHWVSEKPDGVDHFTLVSAFQEDHNGKMWIAGEHFGLAMADVRAVRKGVQNIILEAGGRQVRNVANLALDQQGFLWLEHPNGITRYDPQTEQSRYFSPGYGLPTTALQLITTLGNGQLLLGIPGGLALFHPEDLTPNSEMPAPYLTSFKVFDQVPEKLASLKRLDELRLSYRQNFFSFEFSALAFNLPDQVRFRYRLMGFDPQWNEAGQRRYASYTNIPGGDYVFELQAANNEGVWNSEQLSIPIHITTPWWKALWFWIPLGLFSFLAVVFALRWRIQQVRQQEQIKSEFDKKLTSMELHALRAQMNPHFIFNCLNSIDYYIIKNETEKASDYLNRFSRLIRLILQNSRAEYVNLKDELEALKLYMEMESLRFDDRFDYVVRVGSGLQLENLEIPPLLLQPYVENAIWHGLARKTAGKNRLDLTITRDNGSLFCRIEDNGIGREAAAQLKSETTGTHRSMGMYITRDRLQLINRLHQARAEVQITDLKDENGQAGGTRVDIIIPIR